MSLSVSVISKKHGEDVSDLEKEINPEYENGLFGFESCRKTLWGHPVMQSLNCGMIFSLRTAIIFAYDDDVLQLKAELIKIADNIDQVSKETGNAVWEVKFRVDNALAAIEVVEKNLDRAGILIG